MALALLSKYNAAALLLAGAACGLLRGAGARRVGAWCLLGCSGLAVYFGLDALSGGRAMTAAWTVTSQAAGLPTSCASHRLRSLLAFLGGGGLVIAVWPLLLWRLQPRVAGAAAVLSLFLFSPLFDLGLVRPVDRVTGAVLGFGTILALAAALRPSPGRTLWLPWLASGLALAAAYWSVMARTVLLAVPPAIFLLAGLLEERFTARACRGLCLASLAAVLGLGLALSIVDFRYAGSQRELAREVSSRYLEQGRRVWFTGHWGLQYYLERAGARSLDAGRGGWDEVRAGDVVVVPRVNANILRPSRRLLADVTRSEVSSFLPLRLICSGRCEAGFYSDVMGFLPFSLSREPVDVHEVVEAL
jgi:hypothetical protein